MRAKPKAHYEIMQRALILAKEPITKTKIYMSLGGNNLVRKKRFQKIIDGGFITKVPVPNKARKAYYYKVTERGLYVLSLMDQLEKVLNEDAQNIAKQNFWTPI